MTRIPRLAPTRSASGTPSVLSWSVSAMTRTPESRASRTRSAGASRPSDTVLCKWRSSEPLILRQAQYERLLAGVVDGACLADDRDLDLARVLERLFDL